MSDVVDSKASKEEGSEQSHKSKMKIKRKQSVALKNETMGKFITRSAILIALLLPVAGLFGILFTAKGWGATVVRTLEPYYDISRLVAAGGLGMIILLYFILYIILYNILIAYGFFTTFINMIVKYFTDKTINF